MFKISHKTFHIPDFAYDSRWAGNNSTSLPSPSSKNLPGMKTNPGTTFPTVLGTHARSWKQKRGKSIVLLRLWQQKAWAALRVTAAPSKLLKSTFFTEILESSSIFLPALQWYLPWPSWPPVMTSMILQLSVVAYSSVFQTHKNREWRLFPWPNTASHTFYPGVGNREQTLTMRL